MFPYLSIADLRLCTVQNKCNHHWYPENTSPLKRGANPKQTNYPLHPNMHHMHHLIHNAYMTFMHIARIKIQGLVVGIQANPQLGRRFLWVSSYPVIGCSPLSYILQPFVDKTLSSSKSKHCFSKHLPCFALSVPQWVVSCNLLLTETISPQRILVFATFYWWIPWASLTQQCSKTTQQIRFTELWQ